MNIVEEIDAYIDYYKDTGHNKREVDLLSRARGYIVTGTKVEE